MRTKKCIDCEELIEANHFNTKRCLACKSIVLKRPIGKMSMDQINEAKRLAGTMPRENIAIELGVSLSNLKRSCPDVRFTFFNHLKNNPNIVKEVCKYYEKHGLKKTSEQYPEIRIRSLVERYKIYRPRQIKWKDEELIELAKFAGLIPLKEQAKFFNRPRANEGSIKSAWYKKFKTTPCFMHGLPVHKAKLFLEPGFPSLNIKRQISGDPTKIVIFSDAVNFLRKDCPDFVQIAIKAMAEFQNKLFGNDPRAEIENILFAFSNGEK